MFSHQTVFAQTKVWNPACMVDGVPTLKCLEDVFGNIIFSASTLIILVLFIMFVIGAFTYLTSGGNPERVKKAQGTLKYAIIGFVLFLSAFLILQVINVLFLGGKGTIFRFEIP
jgi:Type IV secretion system pilin